MRGSSMPQISSGCSRGLGINVGSLSICQLSTPFRERAAQRWDKPRRSSTRHRSSVDPSASRVAPALNTLLMEYGQSLAVKIGLAGCRRSSDSWRIVVATLIGVHSVAMAQNLTSGSNKQFTAGSRAMRFWQRADFQQCHQERKGGFGSLVLVGAVGMQAVPAAAGHGIIERKLQIVIAKEPIEGRPSLAAPTAVPGYAVGLQAGGNRSGGLQRLLIEAGLFTTLAVEALRPDRYKVAIGFAMLSL